MGGVAGAVVDFMRTIFVWAIRLSFVVIVVFAFIAMLNFILSFMFVTMNQTVLNDIFALVQIGLPFNLNVLLGWLITASSLYIFYKLTLAGLTFMNIVLGNN